MRPIPSCNEYLDNFCSTERQAARQKRRQQSSCEILTTFLAFKVDHAAEKMALGIAIGDPLTLQHEPEKGCQRGEGVLARPVDRLLPRRALGPCGAEKGRPAPSRSRPMKSLKVLERSIRIWQDSVLHSVAVVRAQPAMR